MTYESYIEIYKSVERIINRFQFAHYDYLKIGKLERCDFDRINKNPNNKPYYYLYGARKDTSYDLLGHIWGNDFDKVMDSVDELLDSL